MRGLAVTSGAVAAFLAAGLFLGHPIVMPKRPARPRGESLADRQLRWLRQAGLSVTSMQFLVSSAAIGLMTLASVAAMTHAWTVGIVPAALMTLGPRAYFGRIRKKRLAAVTTAWPDGLRDLAASVNASLPLHRALVELALSGPAPLRDAFTHYESGARTLGVVPALERIKEEVANPTTDRVMEVLILAHERGPENLGSILDELADSIGRDLRTVEEIETGRQEPRINMAVAATVPWGLVLLICLSNTPHRTYYASGRGAAPVILSALLTFGGMAAVRMLARDPIEHRLFVTDAERRR